MPHFSLFTATGAYNLGDELILSQEYLYLKNRYPDATFSVFTYDTNSSLLPDDTNIQYLTYFPCHLRTRPLQNIWYLLRTLSALVRSDYVIIGGGGLLYDNEPRQSFARLLFLWRFRVWVVRLFGKPLIYWSLGIHIRQENRQKILPFFQGSKTYVSVRDTESQKVLTSLGVQSTLIMDSVLSYDPEIPQLLVKCRPKIGLSFRAGFLRDESINIEKIIAFLMLEGYEPILLNHSFHLDSIAVNDDVFLRALQNKYQLRSTKNIQETLDAYKELSGVVGMRLHSLILSFVHAIPFLALSYGKKTDEFVQSIGHTYVLSARTFDMEVFKTLFFKLEKEKDEQKFALNAKNDTIKHDIYITTNIFFDGLEKS